LGYESFPNLQIFSGNVSTFGSLTLAKPSWLQILRRLELCRSRDSSAFLASEDFFEKLLAEDMPTPLFPCLEELIVHVNQWEVPQPSEAFVAYARVWGRLCGGSLEVCQWPGSYNYPAIPVTAETYGHFFLWLINEYQDHPSKRVYLV
jgi:hypothetical protein